MNKKILVVDDEIDLVSMITLHLRANNYFVVSCYSALDAFEITEREKPDLILMDVMMPGIDGLTLCRKIKEDKELKKIPIIIYTGKCNIAETIEEKAKEAGADDYSLKPFESEVLLGKIKKLLAE